MLAREGFDGPRVWDNKSTPRRIAGRDRRVRRDEGEFEVRSSRFSELSNPELRTSDSAFLACLALRAARSMAAGGVFQHPAC